MGRASQEFDRQLFTLKLSELSQQMQIKSVASDRKAGAEVRKTGGSQLVKIVDGQLVLLREWLGGVDQICREVWQIQGRTLMPEFVRDVLLPEAFNVIEARRGSIMSDVSLRALRTRSEDPHAAQHHLTMEVNALKSKVSTQYEIEALTLGHKTAKPVLAAPGSRDPKPIGVPPNPPMYFPSDLWSETNVILLEAQRKFPQQTQTLELCRHVTAEMTPVFCEAVKGGKIRASSVLQEGCGGMQDLLHSLLVYNDDEPHSGFSSLSDKAYRLGQEVRRSDEWLTLAKEIAVTQGNSNSANAVSLRTGEKQTEPSLAQNENLRRAILNKKARIAEIERTLNRPLTTEHRGRAIHGGESWRLRLEEEMQHLLIAVSELEAELEHSTVFRVQNNEKTAKAEESKSTHAAVSRRRERDNPEVAKRAVIVRSNSSVTAEEMCQIFDREKVPLSAKWLGAGFDTWSKAYKNSVYRSRIHTLISKDRQKT